IDIGFGDHSLRTIVGIVGDIRQEEIRPESELTIYIPYLQADKQWQLADMTFTVKSDSDLGSRTSELRAAIASVDKALPVYDIKPMRQIVSDKVADPRFYTLILAVLSFIALILAAAGVYGVVSYSVGQRIHEIGIRTALGARHAEVVRMFVSSAFFVALVGVGAGLAGAYGLTRFIQAFLYQTSPTDTATFAGVSSLLIAVALVASYIPARRATRVDPVVALRHE
ncbi:MAG TPA: FtsX-like permease family protein, partial [Blastocatellia bacterium]